MRNRIDCICLGLAASFLLATAACATSNASTSQLRKTKTPKAPVNTGYSESRKERDQRLLRECKGKPNAGACEGFAN
jgi:hypothetical protein